MKTWITLALCALLAPAAMAEKADSNKPTEISARNGGGNVVDGKAELEGNVRISRGTLLLTSQRALVLQDAEGYQYVTMWAGPGGLASFRQKRDGGDLWIEGEAERIEYDNKSEVVKFFSKAKLRQLEGRKVTREASGAFYSYSNRTEVFSLLNQADGSDKKDGGDVHITIQPPVIKPAASTPGKQ